MAQQVIDVGVSPNDGTGDPIRTAYQKANANFTELYALVEGGASPNAIPIESPSDLDDFIEPGSSSQAADAGATAPDGANYPFEKAGLLRVGATEDRTLIYQDYTADGSFAWRVRSEGTWSTWTVAASATALAALDTRVVTAQDAADGAADAASTAQGTANSAASAAEDAQDTADAAALTATIAGTAASQAQDTADEAGLAAVAAQETADAAIPLTQKGAAGGVAPLDGEGYVPAENLRETDSGGLPVGFTAWCNLRAAIWEGFIPYDGQIVNRATFPDLAQMAIDGLVPVVSDGDWLADPLKRGSFTLGDGSTTIRLPDFNGQSSGSLGAVVLRGDGLRSAGTDGLLQADALQNITAAWNVRPSSATTFTMTAGEGAVDTPLTTSGSGVNQLGSSGTGGQQRVTFDASRVARTDVETRALNATGCWVVKAFGAVLNPGSVDAAQLASDLAALDAAFQTLNGQVDFAMVYPNGGSAGSPANVAINTRYVIANPFPGYRVICIPEIQIDGVWGNPRWLYNNGGQGVRASQHNDSGIVVQTGQGALFSASANSGSSFGTGSNPPGSADPKPCRVRVYKIRGAI
jgi:hypothetical protein